MRNALFPAITSALIALGLPAPTAAQDTTDQQLGSVSFQTSCNEAAQRRFDRGMRYQHSYWYAQSREIFEEALKADPSCAIAYWGIALGLWDNQHNPPPASEQRARAGGDPEGAGDRRQDPARARLHRRDGAALHRL